MADEVVGQTRQARMVEKPCRSTSIVEMLKSMFEVGHKRETEKTVHARNRLEKNRWREKHEFEAKRKGPVPSEIGRQVPTMQAAQQDTQLIDEVVHIPALGHGRFVLGRDSA